jgi:hypothetical protein
LTVDQTVGVVEAAELAQIPVLEALAADIRRRRSSAPGSPGRGRADRHQHSRRGEDHH